MHMAKAVSHLASKTPGKESIAIESFANALRQVFLNGRFSYASLVNSELKTTACGHWFEPVLFLKYSFLTFLSY